MLTNGGPAYSSEVLANFLYYEAFYQMKVGYASSIGALMFVYVFIITALFGLLRRLGLDI